MTSILSLLLSAVPSQPMIAPEPFTAFPASPFSAYRPVVRPPEDFPELEYTYIEANYIVTDSKAADDTLDGYELTGSFELPANFFLQASVIDQSGDADITKYRVGAGWHLGFLSRFDAYGIISYEKFELDGTGDDFDDDSPAAELGLRFLLIRALELNARGQWSDNGEGDPSVGVGARYYFNESLSIGARFDTTGDDDTASVGLRFEI